MSDVTNRVSEQMDAITAQSKEFVEEHALPSAVIAFGVGVGAGIALASLLANSLPSRHTSVTQKLGRQVLDAMSAVMPDSLLKH